MSRWRLLFVDNLAVEAARRSVYRELSRRKEFEVHLMAPTNWKEAGNTIVCEEEQDLELTIHKSHFLFGHRAHRVLYASLPQLVRKLQPHFLYVDTEPENYLALEAILTVKLFSPNTRLGVVSSRNIDHRITGFPYKLAFTHRFCDNILLKRIDMCFLRAKAAALVIGPHVRRTCYIPFPVDCKFFEKKLTPSRNKAQGRLTIGFLGRFVESKGIRLLLEIMPGLPSNVDVLMVGKGPMLDEIYDLTKRLQLENRVKVLSAVRYSQVPALLNQIDVLVLPSLSTKYWVEQCPRVLIEAMACEVPIVASRSGGIPDVVGDAGILFESGDAHDFADKLLKLLNDAEMRRDTGRVGRARALSEFDVSVIAGRLASAICEMLQGNPQSALTG